MATSLVLLLQRCHYIRYFCWSSATLRYACLYSATLSDMHAGFIYSDTRVCKVLLHQARNWYVTNPPDMPTGKVRLPWAFKTYQLPVTKMMSVTQESVKSAFCIHIPGVCQSQGKFSYIYTPRKLCLWWVYCFHVVLPSVLPCMRPFVTFCFLNILNYFHQTLQTGSYMQDKYFRQKSKRYGPILLELFPSVVLNGFNIGFYAYAFNIIGHTQADQLLPQLLTQQFDTFPIQCRHI